MSHEGFLPLPTFDISFLNQRQSRSRDPESRRSRQEEQEDSLKFPRKQLEELQKENYKLLTLQRSESKLQPKHHEDETGPKNEEEQIEKSVENVVEEKRVPFSSNVTEELSLEDLKNEIAKLRAENQNLEISTTFGHEDEHALNE